MRSQVAHSNLSTVKSLIASFNLFEGYRLYKNRLDKTELRINIRETFNCRYMQCNTFPISLT